MRRLLLLPIAACLALFAPVAPAGADDNYGPGVPTSCRVTVPSAVAGERVVLRVVVSASTNLAVTGSVEIIVNRVAAARTATSARPTWTKTVRYEGSPVSVVGPRLSRGDHAASIRFTPDAETFAGCEDAVRFRVGAAGEVGGEDEGAGTGGSDAGGSDAGLPDTGGPPLLALLMGAGLVVTGGGLVGGSRRSLA